MPRGCVGLRPSERRQADRTGEHPGQAPRGVPGRHGDHDDRLAKLASDEPRADVWLTGCRHALEVDAVRDINGRPAAAAREHVARAIDPPDPAGEDRPATRRDPLEVGGYELRVRIHHRRRLRDGAERRDAARQIRVHRGSDQHDPRAEIADRAVLVVSILPPRERRRHRCEDQYRDDCAADQPAAEHRRCAEDQPVDGTGAPGARALTWPSSEPRRRPPVGLLNSDPEPSQDGVPLRNTMPVFSERTPCLPG